MSLWQFFGYSEQCCGENSLHVSWHLAFSMQSFQYCFLNRALFYRYASKQKIFSVFWEFFYSFTYFFLVNLYLWFSTNCDTCSIVDFCYSGKILYGVSGKWFKRNKDSDWLIWKNVKRNKGNDWLIHLIGMF